MHRWHASARLNTGPSTSQRGVLDLIATPLFSQLGYRLIPAGGGHNTLHARLDAGGRAAAVLVVTGWGQDPSSAWRETVLLGLRYSLRWACCLTGPALRIVDAQRTYSRRFVEFDLAPVFDEPRAFAVLWGLLRAPPTGRRPRGAPEAPGLFDRAVVLSERHRASVRSSLQVGVNDALTLIVGAFERAIGARARSGISAQRTFDEALTVIYRILFLLFAEARGLVPLWHPLYHDAYSIEALRATVETLPRPPGVWETLQAIARLAHRGCGFGALAVTPFNGHLFSPSEAPLADSVPLDDGAVRTALLTLTTAAGRGGRERISYADLGVEQLGGIYERLLDLDPATISRAPRARAGKDRGCSGPARTDRRKRTGSYYTPRTLTELVVHRALEPLVGAATPDAILGLRVLDPAMGSGAFLVAACRYLAAAYESALLRDSGAPQSSIGDADRTAFRRLVAQRCLYGVDINPMAVQLARLSLWLATLSADRPLTFLDHRLCAGNSLVGASPEDVMRQRPGRPRSTRPLPLFDSSVPDESVGRAVTVRATIADEPGDTLEQVRSKERALGAISGDGSDLAAWRDVHDLWCAAWFNQESASPSVPFPELAAARLGHGLLPRHITQPALDAARQVSLDQRFFHWPLEFPELFYARDGSALDAPGFDAIVGNPPWEVLRGDTGSVANRSEARARATPLVSFSRHSGIYRLQGDGHVNLYLLFLERSLSLLKSGGRLGFVMPSGLLTDQGAAALRRWLFERTSIDELSTIENRDGLFPVHRSLKFLVVSTTKGGSTGSVRCRFAVRSPAALEREPDADDGHAVIRLDKNLIERFSGPQLAIPELRNRRDLDIVSQLVFTIPALGDAEGWGARFGRELNATEDKSHFRLGTTGLPVIAGKQLTPFAVDIGEGGVRIDAKVAATLLDPASTFGRRRLAYRDVASPANRLTLIAAIVPRGVVTTHTLFCLKTLLDEDAQLFLCGMFNSFVANYLVRLRVGTHVTTAIVDRLTMPRPPRESAAYREVRDLSGDLERQPGDAMARVRLQAAAAQLYGLDGEQFAHVLESFPLVAASERAQALAMLRARQLGARIEVPP